MSDQLFSPVKFGDTELKNRIVMAPLTRARAGEQGIPGSLMAEYYAQRASSGLIIAEATAISADGRGWINSPGMFNDAQQAGWKKVADAVHQQGGKIFVQLWHMGAAVHPDFIEGRQPVSASDVPLEGVLATPAGRDRPLVAPRPLTIDEIDNIVQQFAQASRRAIDAGIDGVEIHGANGFLIDQFTRDSTNKRTDQYGGPISNRLRFMEQVVKAVTDEIGARKTAIRLSPTNQIWGISDSSYRETFLQAVKMLEPYGLAYLHLLEPKPDSGHAMPTIDYLTPEIRQQYSGTLLLNGGYDKVRASEAVDRQQGEAIAFGFPFIANPDFAERLKEDIPLSEPDPQYFYSGEAKGYTDYPFATR